MTYSRLLEDSSRSPTAARLEVGRLTDHHRADPELAQHIPLQYQHGESVVGMTQSP